MKIRNTNYLKIIILNKKFNFSRATKFPRKTNLLRLVFFAFNLPMVKPLTEGTERMREIDYHGTTIGVLDDNGILTD
ncbi:hypothetical protein G033_13220 [Pectobacterium peruviense]|nr:hypothetical protein G033_13220 [Pectobacterium peruviense]